MLTCALSSNLLIILAMMQVSKKVAFEDPDVLNMVRAGYVLSNVIIVAITLYIKFVVDKKKGTSCSGHDTPVGNGSLGIVAHHVLTAAAVQT